MCTDASDRTAIRFELIDFKFWRISYDSTRELWTMICEDVTTYLYGDAASGRSIWSNGVRWGNWLGSSTSYGQQRYANG